jgi:hypothetical protein
MQSTYTHVKTVFFCLGPSVLLTVLWLFISPITNPRRTHYLMFRVIKAISVLIMIRFASVNIFRVGLPAIGCRINHSYYAAECGATD